MLTTAYAQVPRYMAILEENIYKQWTYGMQSRAGVVCTDGCFKNVEGIMAWQMLFCPLESYIFIALLTVVSLKGSNLTF